MVFFNRFWNRSPLERALKLWPYSGWRPSGPRRLAILKSLYINYIYIDIYIYIYNIHLHIHIPIHIHIVLAGKDHGKIHAFL